MIRTRSSPQEWRLLAPFMLAALAFCAAWPLHAQQVDEASADTLLEQLKSCQLVTDDGERLACFDRAAGAMVSASDAGDVRVLDREAVRQTRRSLFGYRIPDLGIFGGGEEVGDNSDELFETTIERARYLSSKRVQFTTAEGAVWEMKNVPRRLRQIEPGDAVVFKPAALGYFFVRIDGQMGIKGRRIE
ncbi:MAG: hypothetical protein V2I43_26625 [Parvularcula sp.]|nr:hypothetical protein [Parvularcula sp.]